MKKSNYALVSFISALVFGAVALFCPPLGVIDNSVLWFTAQLLVFVSNILGFNLDVFKSNKNV